MDRKTRTIIGAFLITAVIACGYETEEEIPQTKAQGFWEQQEKAWGEALRQSLDSVEQEWNELKQDSEHQAEEWDEELRQELNEAEQEIDNEVDELNRDYDQFEKDVQNSWDAFEKDMNQRVDELQKDIGEYREKRGAENQEKQNNQ